MRSMSMLQLLGGVAAAGVVAAGATAFTASGITPPGGNTFIGGSTAIVPVGASISSVTAAWNAAGTEITTMTVNFTGGGSSDANGKTGTMEVTDATGNSNGGAPAFNCGAIAGGTMTCTAGAPYTVGSITNIAIAVV